MNLIKTIKKSLAINKMAKQSKRDLDKMYIQQEEKMKALAEGLDKHDK